MIAQQLEQQLEDKFNKRRSIRQGMGSRKDEEEVLQTRVVSAEEVSQSRNTHSKGNCIKETAQQEEG